MRGVRSTGPTRYRVDMSTALVAHPLVDRVMAVYAETRLADLLPGRDLLAALDSILVELAPIPAEL